MFRIQLMITLKMNTWNRIIALLEELYQISFFSTCHHSCSKMDQLQAQNCSAAFFSCFSCSFQSPTCYCSWGCRTDKARNEFSSSRENQDQVSNRSHQKYRLIWCNVHAPTTMPRPLDIHHSINIVFHPTLRPSKFRKNWLFSHFLKTEYILSPSF